MKKKSFFKISNIIILFLVILFTGLLLGFVSPLKLTKYDISFSTLPEEFDGYKILQISDFHCKEFGDKEQDFINLCKSAEPDLIVLTGDIVDEDHDTENAKYLLEGLYEVAPMYYVTGNHEFYDGAPYDEFRELCNIYGVKILEDEKVAINRDGAKIYLSGMDFTINYATELREKLGYADAKYFNILLFHDGSKFNYLSEYGYDLVFAGHIHGGLMRMPIKGGVFASDYTFFPKYDKGIYKDKNSTMVLSAGLGDARIPRWNNPRECVLVTLHAE